MYQACLVLEGGGMRGLYTTGVLDVFLQNSIEFSHCIGVSAGACHGASFVCGQEGRSRDVSVDYLDDKNYCGFYSLITTGNLFNTQMVYGTIPREYYPLDTKHYVDSGCKLYAVVTNCISGKAEYVHITDPMKNLDWIRASASLPLVSKTVKIGGGKYLDGGIADSIPIEKGIELCPKKTVVILTRNRDYRKSPDSLYPLMKLRYAKYPYLVKQMKNRHLQYNRSLSLIEQLESKGEIFVIRPIEPMTVARVEKDKEKLLKLYRQGVRDAQRQIDDLKKYLEKDGKDNGR